MSFFHNKQLFSQQLQNKHKTDKFVLKSPSIVSFFSSTHGIGLIWSEAGTIFAKLSELNDSDGSLGHNCHFVHTSGTFTPFLARTFESSLAKVHKITKKVGQNRSAPLGSFNFTGKRLSLLVSVHMAFVEGMLIKQMRLFLGVQLFGKHYRFRPQMQLFLRSVCMGPTLLD